MTQLEKYFLQSREFLEEFIDPDFGLIENLFSNKVINRREMKNIKAKDSYYERNSLLIDIIIEKKKITELCVALTKTMQNHIVNYLKLFGVRNSQLNEDWPLTKKETSILQANYQSLTDLIDTCDLIGRLYSVGVINKRQLDFISSKSTSYEKNEALLEILGRCSLKSYRLTIKCLHLSNQSHIAEILETGGAIVRVHATLESENLDEAETQIVQKMTDILRESNVSVEQANRLLSATQLNIFAVKRGQSIVLYVCCSKEEELFRLWKISDQTEIKTLLENLFNLLIYDEKIKVLSLKISNVDCLMAKEFFKNQVQERWKNQIDRHYDFILDRMSLDLDLFENLFANHVLTNRKKKEIMAQKRFYERNEILLQYLTREQKLEKLIEALLLSDQKHLVKYLEFDGRYDPMVKGEWPLTEKEILIIASNYEVLVDYLDTCNLLGRLYSTGVINKRQLQLISSKSESHQKNEALLDILRRSSLRSYWQAINCLHATNQSHIAEILETGGVTLCLTAYLKEEEGVNMKATGEKIATEINILLRKRSILESSFIWKRLCQFRLIGARHDSGVRLCFLCNRSNKVDHLEKLTTDGRLNLIIESLFNQLMKLPTKIKISLEWTSNIFKRCREMIQEIDEQVLIADLPLTTINSLPLEVLDIILKKCFTRDEEIITQLASVSYCWFKRITQQRFKRAVLSHKSSVTRNVRGVLSIYNINQQFVEQTMTRLQCDKNYLKYCDVISDIGCALIKATQHSAMKKRPPMNGAIGLSIVSTFMKEANQHALHNYLHQSGEKSVLKVIDNGGVAVRIEIKSRLSKQTSWRQRFVKRIIEVKDGALSLSSQLESVIAHLQRDGIEILNSLEDRDAVVWIWCKSSNALEKLNEMNKSKELLNLFRRLSKENIQFTNVDYDQLKKESILFVPLIFDFATTLNVHERQNKSSSTEIRGVTKLKNKIYIITCQKSQEIRYVSQISVFDDRVPFSLVEKIDLPSIDNPLDIVSDDKDNTHYILDDGFYVWKAMEHHRVNWLRFNDDFRPSSLYVTNDRELLMVSGYRSTLRIYGSDAKLRHSIALHPRIIDPKHAVETSAKDFVIYHLKNFDKEMTVSVLSRDGKTIIRTFKPENEEQIMSSSLFSGYLCIDSVDQVFVTDRYNERVFLLDSNLQWKHILVPTIEEIEERNGMKILQFPTSCYYDEKSKQLVVCGRFQANLYTLRQ